MTPSEKLEYLESLAARKPHARAHTLFDKLRVYETADNLKRAMEPKSRQETIIEELRALGRAAIADNDLLAERNHWFAAEQGGFA